MKAVRRIPTLSICLTSLAAVALVACDPPDRADNNDDNNEPRALTTIHGQVESAIEAAPPTDLRAYLYWNAVDSQSGAYLIDETAVSGSLPSSFSLSITEAPQEDAFFRPDDGGTQSTPRVAVAMVFVATADVGHGLLESSAEAPYALVSDTVIGFSRTFIVYLATDEDAAALEASTGLAVSAGFNLVAPNAEAEACNTLAFEQLDGCVTERGQGCANQDPDSAAYSDCIEPCFDVDVEECGPTHEVQSFEEPLTVELIEWTLGES